MGILDFGQRVLFAVLSVVWFSKPITSKCVKRATNVFELEFDDKIKGEPLTEYIITFEYNNIKKRVSKFVNGDGSKRSGKYMVALKVPPNITFSIKVEDCNGNVLLEKKSLKSQSYQAKTEKLMQYKLEDRKKELMNEILNSIALLDGSIKIANFSITASGKSTLFNEFFRLLGSNHVPFPTGDVKAGQAYNLFEKRIPNMEFCSAYTTEVLKRNLDDVEKMNRLWFWDSPGFFHYNTAKESYELLSVTSKLFESIFKIETGENRERGNTNQNLEEIPNAVVATIPLEDVFVFNRLVDNGKGEESVLTYYSSISSYLIKKSAINCIYCYTKIDQTYLYKNYISSNAEIISMIEGEDKLSSNELKLDLLKHFYEWDLLERNDNTRSDLVASDYSIPFMSKNAPTEDIKLFFEVQYFELLNLLLKKAYHTKSAKENTATQILFE